MTTHLMALLGVMEVVVRVVLLVAGQERFAGPAVTFGLSMLAWTLRKTD